MKFRVLHLLNTESFSGAENVAITIIKSLPEEIDAYYVSPNGSICDVLDKEGINFIPLDKQRKVFSLKKIVDFYEPNLIHAHDYTMGVLASMISGKIPVINHVHNNSPWIKKINLKSVLYGFSCLKVKKILIVSDPIKEEFIFGSFFNKKYVTIGNPIDISKIRKIEMEDNIKEKSNVIFLGRLTEAKNPLFFIRIIENVKKRVPNVKVSIVGDGEMIDDVRMMIKKLDLEENTKIYGFVNNPYGLLKNSQVLCLPSKWEGYGLAAVEALALGTPVVSSRAGGLKSIVNCECGALCSDLESYVSEIVSIISDRQIYEKKSAQAQMRAEQIDNIDCYMQSLLSIYESLGKNEI